MAQPVLSLAVSALLLEILQ